MALPLFSSLAFLAIFAFVLIFGDVRNRLFRLYVFERGVVFFKRLSRTIFAPCFEDPSDAAFP
jgi:hypothetical protein